MPLRMQVVWWPPPWTRPLGRRPHTTGAQCHREASWGVRLAVPRPSHCRHQASREGLVSDWHLPGPALPQPACPQTLRLLGVGGWGGGCRQGRAGQGRATPTASESIITWWSFFAAKLGPSKSWASQEASGLTSPHLSQMRSQTTEKTLHFAGEQKTKHTRLHSSQH